MEEVGPGQIDDDQIVRLSLDDDSHSPVFGLDEHRRIPPLGLRERRRSDEKQSNPLDVSESHRVERKRSRRDLGASSCRTTARSSSITSSPRRLSEQRLNCSVSPIWSSTSTSSSRRNPPQNGRSFDT